MRFLAFVALLTFCAATPLVKPEKDMKEHDSTFHHDAITNDRADLPVLQASEKENEYLTKAVAEVVNADPEVPMDKKDEATAFAVKQIKEGFEKSQMTHGQLVATVEAEAAKRNATEKTPEEMAATDRSWGGHRVGHWGRRWGRRWGGRYGFGGFYPGYYGYYSGYYPGYYPGYGYNNCLYGYAYGYCQQQLYGAYAYYGGYHNYWRHPYWREEETAETNANSTALSDLKLHKTPESRVDETPKAMMANLTETLKKVESAAVSDRLDDAAKHAEEVKEITKKVEDAKLIEREEAMEIKKLADNVQKAAATGDKDNTLEHAKILKGQVDPSGVQGAPQDRDVSGDDVRCNDTCNIGLNKCAHCCLTTANNGGDPLGRKFKGGHCNWFTCWCEQ